MKQYTDLEWPALLDLLVKHTQAYNNMLSNKVFKEDEFVQCKQTLAEIHLAIKNKSEEQGHPMNNVLPNFPDFFPGYPNLDTASRSAKAAGKGRL